MRRIALARLAVLTGLLAAWEVWASRGNPLLYVPPSRLGPALGRVLRLDAFGPENAQMLDALLTPGKPT